MKMKIEKFYKFNENLDLDEIMNKIDLFPKKIKIGRKYTIYDDPLITSISNSNITKFYQKHKRNAKLIPFPYDKITPEISACFLKLNEIAKIYEQQTVRISLVKYICLNLMDIVLYDLYFDIKSYKFDIYDEVSKLEIPSSNNLEIVKFSKIMMDKDGPMNLIIFYSLTNDIINEINGSL